MSWSIGSPPLVLIVERSGLVFHGAVGLHCLPLLGTKLLGDDDFYRHVLIAFLMMVRRQLLDAVVRDLFLVVVLHARVDFHPYVAVQCLDIDLSAKDGVC